MIKYYRCIQIIRHHNYIKYCRSLYVKLIKFLMHLLVPQTWPAWASLWVVRFGLVRFFRSVTIKSCVRSWSVTRKGSLVSFSLLKLSKTWFTNPLRFLIVWHRSLFTRTVCTKYLSAITAMVLPICDWERWNKINVNIKVEKLEVSLELW